MAEPVEIYDDLSAVLALPSLPIPPTPPGIIRVVQVSKVYVAGSVRIFIHGYLQQLDALVELDPAQRLVGISGDVLDAEEEASLHVTYLTLEEVAQPRPDAPVHISQLRPGDVLRIAMKAGRHLEPVVSRRGQQPRLIARERSRVARNFSRTVFMGMCTRNSPQLGSMDLQVPHRGPREHYAATVDYRDIKFIRKFITPTREPRPVPVGGGPRAVRHPGAIAKGVLDSPGFARLVMVKF